MATTPRAPQSQSRIVTERIFRFLLQLEFAKARRLQYCVSVLCVSPDLTTTTTNGRLLERVRRMAPAIAENIRTTDVVAVRAPDSLAIMAINADTSNLPLIVDRATARLQGLYHFADGELTWSAGGACYPKTIVNGGDILRQATDLMAMARRDGGNRLYLPSPAP